MSKKPKPIFVHNKKRSGSRMQVFSLSDYAALDKNCIICGDQVPVGREIFCSKGCYWKRQRPQRKRSVAPQVKDHPCFECGIIILSSRVHKYCDACKPIVRRRYKKELWKRVKDDWNEKRRVHNLTPERLRQRRLTKKKNRLKNTPKQMDPNKRSMYHLRRRESKKAELELVGLSNLNKNTKEGRS